MKHMRIIVCGNRDMVDRALVRRTLDKIHAAYGKAVTIVHGGCPTGADAFADEYARVLGFVVEVHRADWKKFKKRAGPLRNEYMAKLGADFGVAFWNGLSTGTGGMIALCAVHGVKVRVKPHVVPPKEKPKRRPVDPVGFAQREEV